MKRSDLISSVKRYFYISELVCAHTYARFGEQSWQFLDDKLLESILFLREQIFCVAMTVNTSSLKQRGLRCNLCDTVQTNTKKNQQYLSAHILGKAIDFDVKGLSAEQARQKIRAAQSSMPYNFRLEKGVNWVHYDVLDLNNGIKCNEFSA